MTDTEDKPGANVVVIADAFAHAERRKPKPDKTDKTKKGGRPPPPEHPGLGAPSRLPDDAPVTALGTLNGKYFYLDALGFLRDLVPDKHGRTHIISLFGGQEYLNETWPQWKLEEGGWVKKNNFDHGAMAGVLIGSCSDKGAWDPAEYVRGPGCWSEEDGTLVMHCGAHLWSASAKDSTKIAMDDAGVRGHLLYVRSPSLLDPDFQPDRMPGHAILDLLVTWNWARPGLDPYLVLGWIVCAMMGQSLPWRPAIWITGGYGRGKSTLAKLFDRVMGPNGLIRPSQATQAYIYQRIGNSCLPVVLDEFEAKQDNAVQQKIIELMRISSSGGSIGRGTTGGEGKETVMRSAFQFGSINIQSLGPQDRSRLAICELQPLPEQSASAADFDPEADMQNDEVLGDLAKLQQQGRFLRARILQQWHRVALTYRAYRAMLLAAGHSSRGAEQFGALGMAQDIALYDGFDLDRAKAWADDLNPAELAETTGHDDESHACLKWLLGATGDAISHGAKETLAHYLMQSRRDIDEDRQTNDSTDASRILAKIGIRVCKTGAFDMIESTQNGVTTTRKTAKYEVAISSTHRALVEIFKDSHWKGMSGQSGTWAGALRALLPPDGTRKARQMKIDGQNNWVTCLPWEIVFPNDDVEDEQ